MLKDMRQTMLAMAVLLLALTGAPWIATAQDASALPLEKAVLVAPTEGPVSKAADFLCDEVYKRSGIRWYNREPFEGAPLVVVCTADTVPEDVSLPKGLEIPQKAEGFAIGVSGDTVILAGRDYKGALFAAGRLLLLLDMGDRKVSLPRATRVATAPKYSMRVHQLGYRNTSTCCDLWDEDTYEQYLRDLAIFGTNGAELIQEEPPGGKDGPLLALSQWDMNMRLAKLLDAYDLDVFVWYPVPILGNDQEKYDTELGYRKQFFAEIARLDHVFVPGGDPGDNHPKILMPALEGMAGMLHKRFPEAGLFVSNQKMKPEWTEWLFNYIREEQPEWLGGYVYGPGTKHSIMDAREWLPEQYAIRRYPDITHNLRCQFPVPHWDAHHAQSLGREGVNPRPGHNQNVHNAYDEYAVGFGSYSDGLNDDLNKMVWSALAWDPEADIKQIVLDYGRIFFGPDLAEDVAEGLWMFQDNMEGLLIENEGVPKALAKWREIGKKGAPDIQRNWRYQMYLMRAIFDQYTRERLIAETKYEQKAYAALAKAPQTGVAAAIDAARKALAQADAVEVDAALREEFAERADIMFNTIGHQFSAKPPYFSRNPERGALLDKLDVPMNDRPWLEYQFAEILEMSDAEARLARLDTIVNWEDPGPGGFYDDLGNIAKQPHLVMMSSYEENPSRIDRAVESHYRWMNNSTYKVDETFKYSMLDQAQTLHGAPLMVHYEGLDPAAEYKIKVIEFGRFGAEIDLKADNEYVIHEGLRPERPLWPKEYDIPKAATADGVLDLTWGLVDGRGTQVAELWLIKK